jgi:hypothetical protein
VTRSNTYVGKSLILGAIILVIGVILDSALERGEIVSKRNISHLLVDLAIAVTDKPS